MKTTSKTGTGLGVLAALACVGCCALPVLIAAGALSGGAAAFFADSMPAIAVALAVAAAAAFGWATYRRSRGTGCGTTTETGGCGDGSGCGCATTRA